MTESARVTTTVMFADICRSTYLFRQMGDEKAAELIVSALDRAAGIVTSHEGSVLRTQGDDILCIFSNPQNALRAALDIHAINTHALIDGKVTIQMRAGINTGHALVSASDILGDTVNTAARLAASAKAGQTLVSAQTMVLAQPPPGTLIRPVGDMSFKGISGPVPVFELLDAEDQDEITQVGQTTLNRQRTHQLSIHFQSHHDQLNYMLVRYLLGRQTDCDLTLDHPMVSRHHAEIRYQNNEFVLTDFSTNGTTVIRRAQTRKLHHSQTALQGRGTIILGHTTYNQHFAITYSVF